MDQFLSAVQVVCIVVACGYILLAGLYFSAVTELVNWAFGKQNAQKYGSMQTCLIVSGLYFGLAIITLSIGCYCGFSMYTLIRIIPLTFVIGLIFGVLYRLGECEHNNVYK